MENDGALFQRCRIQVVVADKFDNPTVTTIASSKQESSALAPALSAAAKFAN